MRFLSGFMAAGAVGLSLAFTAPAWALSSGDNFSVDQSCGGSGLCSEIGGTLTDVDRVNFTYTARIEQSNDGGPLNGDPFTEKGFANWTGYVNDSDGAVFGSTLNLDYQVYMVFSATGTAVFDGTGIKATFTSFEVSIWMSDDGNTALALPATNAGDVTNGGQAIGNGLGANADDNLIATATLLSAGEANLNAGLANGDFEIIVSDLGLELFGESFLSDPSPFYSIMHFAGNTGNVAPPGSPTEPFSSVATGDGQLFFTVPEPGTLGLLGGGLLGAAALLRRRKAAKAA
jgi:hypothetical protein